jgi:hypothetical protein
VRNIVNMKGNPMKIILVPVLFSAILLSGCITFQILPPNSVQTTGTVPVIQVLTISPTTINAGETSTLLWNVIGATSLSIDQGIGQVDVAGTRVVAPVKSTIYTLSAINTSGTVTRSATVYVNPSSSPSQSQTPTPWFPAISPFAVTSITANTEPSNLTGCYTLYALITTNGPGSVSYIWESIEGGGYSYTWTIRFTEAGTQKIALPMEMSALPSGQYRLHVLTPNDMISNPTYYTTCR